MQSSVIHHHSITQLWLCGPQSIGSNSPSHGMRGIQRSGTGRLNLLTVLLLTCLKVHLAVLARLRGSWWLQRARSSVAICEEQSHDDAWTCPRCIIIRHLPDSYWQDILVLPSPLRSLHWPSANLSLKGQHRRSIHRSRERIVRMSDEIDDDHKVHNWLFPSLSSPAESSWSWCCLVTDSSRFRSEHGEKETRRQFWSKSIKVFIH